MSNAAAIQVPIYAPKTARPHFRVIEGGRGKSHAVRQASRVSVAACMLIALVSVAILSGAWIASDRLSAQRLQRHLAQASTESVVVRSGDSLWSIASEHPIDGCTTSELVGAIRDINGLDSACLYAGMTLNVPTQG